MKQNMRNKYHFISVNTFRHAEVYTTTEVTRITNEKLERLRNLYIDQLYRLKHVLREKRRNYLQSLRVERETLCKYCYCWWFKDLRFKKRGIYKK